MYRNTSLKLGDFRFHVARHGQIDDEQRTVLARLERALHHALAQDRQLAGGAGDDDVVLCQLFRQVGQRDRGAVDAPRQCLRAFQRAVGDGDVLRGTRREMHRVEFDHLAGADEQHALLGDAREDALGQPDRGGSHRHQVRADLGLGAHVLGHRKSALEQFVQQETQRAGLLGLAHRLFHLPEYLRFAQHHRIQSARHAERMLHRLFARQRVKIRLDLLARQLVILRQPVDRAWPGWAALQYSSMRLQVDRIAASLAAPFSTRSRRAFSIPSALNATCSRTASGAV